MKNESFWCKEEKILKGKLNEFDTKDHWISLNWLLREQ